MAKEIRFNLVVHDDGTTTLNKFDNAFKRVDTSIDKAERGLHGWRGAMSKAKAGASGLTSGMAGLASKAMSLKNLLIGGVGIYTITRAMKEWIEKSNFQEKTLAGLHQSVVSMGRDMPGFEKGIIDTAVAYQGLTTFGDEAILSGTKFLMTYKQISNEEMPRAMKVMTDLAALMGGDMRSAANMVGKAAMGMTGEMRRAGITIDENTFKTKGFVGVLEEMEEQVGGQAEALRKTGYGGLQALANLLDDVKEKLGDFLKVIMKPFINVFHAEVMNINAELAAMTETDITKWSMDFATKLAQMARLGGISIFTLKDAFIAWQIIIKSVMVAISELAVIYLNAFTDMAKAAGWLVDFVPMADGMAESLRKLSSHSAIMGETFEESSDDSKRAIAELSGELGKGKIKVEEFYQKVMIAIEQEREMTGAVESATGNLSQNTEALKENKEGANQCGDAWERLGESNEEITAAMLKRQIETWEERDKLFEEGNRWIIEEEEKTQKKIVDIHEEARDKMADHLHEFFDAITGSGEDLANWWENIWDRMRGYFLRVIAEMVAGWVLGVQTMNSNQPGMNVTGSAGMAGNLFGLFGEGGGFGGVPNFTSLAGLPGYLGGSLSYLTGGAVTLPGASMMPLPFGLSGAISGIPVVGTAIAGGLSAALPILGVAAAFGAFDKILGKSEHHKMRRERRGYYYGQEVSDLTQAGSFEEMFRVMSEFPIYDYPMESSPGEGAKVEYAGWKYAAQEQAPYEEWMETVGQMDNFLAGIQASMSKTEHTTLGTIAVFRAYGDEVDKLIEYMPGWGEEAQAFAEAWLQVYDNVEAMIVSDVFAKYEEGIISWTRAMKELNLLGLSPMEAHTHAFDYALTTLLEDAEIGSERFFELYENINVSREELAKYAGIAQTVDLIQNAMVGGMELTNDELVNLITYYRDLQLALEGNEAALGRLEAEYDLVSHLFETEVAGAIDMVIAAFSTLEFAAASSAEAVGTAFESAFEAETAQQGWDSFVNSIHQSLYSTIIDAVISAFVASEVYQAALAPFYEALPEAMAAAWASGVFDAEAFAGILGPALELTTGNIAALELAFGPVWEIINQIGITMGVISTETETASNTADEGILNPDSWAGVSEEVQWLTQNIDLVEESLSLVKDQLMDIQAIQFEPKVLNVNIQLNLEGSEVALDQIAEEVYDRIQERIEQGYGAAA